MFTRASTFRAAVLAICDADAITGHGVFTIDEINIDAESDAMQHAINAAIESQLTNEEREGITGIGLYVVNGGAYATIGYIAVVMGDDGWPDTIAVLYAATPVLPAASHKE